MGRRKNDQKQASVLRVTRGAWRCERAPPTSRPPTAADLSQTPCDLARHLRIPLLVLERINNKKKKQIQHSTHSSCCEREYHVTVSYPSAVLLTALTQTPPRKQADYTAFSFLFLSFLSTAVSFPVKVYTELLFFSPCFLVHVFFCPFSETSY